MCLCAESDFQTIRVADDKVGTGKQSFCRDIAELLGWSQPGKSC